MRVTPVRGARVLVTGASSGIGAETARLFAAAGARVQWSGRDGDRLRAAAGPGAATEVADLERPTGPSELADAAGPVDVLVANAGVGWAGEVSTMDTRDVDRLLAVNLRAPIVLTRAVLPGMYERGGGHVVLVSSIAALGVRDEAVYAATKAGLRVFGASLREEAAPHGVSVSVVLPGVVDTPFFGRRGRPYDRARPRPVPARQVAEAILAATVHQTPEVCVPCWLGVPIRVQGALPGVYRRLARRFG